MIPKLRGTFIDKLQGYGVKHDVDLSRISTNPRVTKLEKRSIG
jgi:hypothetical protein